MSRDSMRSMWNNIEMTSNVTLGSRQRAREFSPIAIYIYGMYLLDTQTQIHTNNDHMNE